MMKYFCGQAYFDSYLTPFLNFPLYFLCPEATSA